MDRLHRKAAHKSLDIPDDEMIYADNSKRGIGALGAMGIALAASLVPGGALLYNILNQKGEVEKTVERAVDTTVNEVDSVFRVWVQNADGSVSPYELPRLPPNLVPSPQNVPQAEGTSP